MQSSKLQPALLGGLLLGVLSALPIIKMGNACCCLWVLAGGAVAAYLLQHGQADPIKSGDGAAVGFLAGVVGAFVWQVIALPLAIFWGPIETQFVARILENMDLPENARPVIENLRQNAGFSLLKFLVGSVFTLFISVIFSTLGGLIGAGLFRKKLPPPELDQPPVILP
jgi:hypothetical protein